MAHAAGSAEGMAAMPVRRFSAAAVCTSCAVALAVAGCTTGAETSDSEAEAPLVLTTFTVIADIAQNVAGEHLRVESLIPVGAEVHSYEPTPGDLRRASGADLVLDNGLGLEMWFEQFMADVDAPRVVLTDGVEAIDIASDAFAGRPNPHAWMSPSDAQVYVDNIETAFRDLDADNAESYRANAEAYVAELQAMHTELVEELQQVPARQRALVTCEGAFSYLARDAGLTEQYIWPVNAESEATPQRIASTIGFVEDNDVPAVFCESTVSDSAMQQVVEATEAEFGGVLYVDSLSEPDGPVPTYLDLIRHDVDLIVAGLRGNVSEDDGDLSTHQATDE